jgi:hypothetical protein
MWKNYPGACMREGLRGDQLGVWISFVLHSSVAGVEPSPRVWEKIKKQIQDQATRRL